MRKASGGADAQRNPYSQLYSTRALSKQADVTVQKASPPAPVIKIAANGAASSSKTGAFPKPLPPRPLDLQSQHPLPVGVTVISLGLYKKIFFISSLWLDYDKKRIPKEMTERL